MSDAELQAIRREAERFRNAMDATDFSDTGISLENWPHECCHHGSDLLARHLIDKGLGDFRRIRGRKPGKPYENHIWLESPTGIVIDITGDQDDLRQPSVVVLRYSEWHEGSREKVDQESYDKYLQEVLQPGWPFFNELYDRVQATLEGLRIPD